MTDAFSDELLWHSLPEGADILRAFFSEDRERRVLVYRRRKDGTYSYTDQTLTFDEYEQEYWWQGTDNELSFYDSEESVLSDVAAQTKNLFGFAPVMYKMPRAETRKKTSVLFLALAVVSIAVVICGLLFTFLYLGGILPDSFSVYGSLMEVGGALLLLLFLKPRGRLRNNFFVPLLPTIPREAVIFLYRRKELPENGRVFFSEDGTRRVRVFLRDDGCYSYTYQKLYIESDEEEVNIFSAYASWRTENQSVSLYDSEERALSDIAPLLADMDEFLPPDADARKLP